MNAPPRPRLLALPMAAAIVGLGLSVFYGEQWLALREVGEAELQASTQLNLLLDLQRAEASGGAGDAAALEQRRQQVYAEVTAQLQSEKRVTLRNLLAALAGFLFGAGLLYQQLRARRR
jgi:hypothetical protein